MGNNNKFAFVELKAFGDLVILAASLRLLSEKDRKRCIILAAPHLQDLVRSLAVSCRAEFLEVPEYGLPALFDLRNQGIVNGLYSALMLRVSLKHAVTDATLVLPKMGLRESFIVGKRDWLTLPLSDNIYLSYSSFMLDSFGIQKSSSTDLLLTSTSRTKRVALCPFSRVNSKNIPPDLVLQLSLACRSVGFEMELILLDGEQFDYSVLPLRKIIPRRFDTFADALAMYAAVVSADSLAAHLAEYCYTPSFIVSPVENRYWLPKNAFIEGNWGLFSAPEELLSRLRRFLIRLL